MRLRLLALAAVLAVLALPGIARAGYATAVLSTHPTAYWPLDETAGPGIFDLSGNRHSGTYTLGCCGVDSSLGASGIPIGDGTALHIHGNVSVYSGANPGGMVSVPATGWNGWNGTAPFSVSLWVKWDGYAKTCVSPTLCSDLTEGIVGNSAWHDVSGGWDLQLNGATGARGDGLLRFVRGTTTLTGPVLPNGEWTMVTATYDGTTSRIYVNGELAASQVDRSSVGGGYDTLFIGAQDYNRYFSGYWGSFNGTIDEVAYWNRAVTADEVQGLYTGRGTRQLPTVYFVPGIGGTELDVDAVPVWPNAVFISGIPQFPPFGVVVDELIKRLEVAEDGVTPKHYTEAVKVQDRAFTQDQYGTFLGEMTQLQADGAIGRFVPWPYDWRIGVRTVAARLARQLEASCNTGRTWLIGHSTGGIVIKTALRIMRDDGKDPEQCLGGGGVVFLATPHLGAPKAIGSEINPDIFFGVATDWQSLLPAAVADEQKLASVLHTWLTPYELMPAQGEPNVPADARPAWFDDLHDGLGDLNVNDDPLSAYLPLAAHTSFVYASDFARTLGSLPVYNVFGAGRATPESYDPGECTTNGNGERVFVNTLDNVHESSVTWGDQTVPAWSGSWRGGPIPAASQYMVPTASHMGVPKDPAVLVLLERILGATNPGVYPDVPGLVHGEAGLERAWTPTGAGYNTTICSPVAVVASYDGASIGVSPNGSVVNTGGDGLFEPAFEKNGSHGGTFFLPDHGGPAPVYRFTAVGDGRVVVHHTDPDGSRHDFVFFVHLGDKAQLAKGASEWELTIDRGGDGTVDDTLAGNSLDVDLSADGGFGAGGLGGFGEGGGIGLDADGLSVDGDVNLDFDWEILDDDGDGTTADEGELEVEGDHASFRPLDGPRTIRIRVTVRNHRGRTASATIAVRVPNAPPSADAGPDVSTPWGVPVALHGSVTDASSADRAAGLHPHWSFGDGSEADGADITHTYAAPGVYTATLTATDKDGASASDTAVVTVTPRASRLEWTGALHSTFGDTVLSARVVDTVDPATARVRGLPLGLDGQTAATGDDGGATFAAALPPLPGTHVYSLELGANALYLANAASVEIDVANGRGKTTVGVTTVSGGRLAGNVQSDGANVKGELEWNALHVSSFDAYGGTWLAGGTDAGERIVFHVGGGRVEVWRAGARDPASGAVAHGSVTVH